MSSGLRLTDDTVTSLHCPAGKKDALFFDEKVKGFGLRVTAKGAKVFLYQYRAGTKVRRQKLGEFSTTTTAQARKLAEVQRGGVHSGADPVADRKARQAAAAAATADTAARRKRLSDAFTVEKLIEDWQHGHLSGRSPSYQAEAPKCETAPKRDSPPGFT